MDELVEDRVIGVLLGAAAGDALGVPYEADSHPLPGPGQEAEMLGGGLGGFAPAPVDPSWTTATTGPPGPPRRSHSTCSQPASNASTVNWAPWNATSASSSSGPDSPNNLTFRGLLAVLVGGEELLCAALQV
jgi:hypothetical protein